MATASYEEVIDKILDRRNELRNPFLAGQVPPSIYMKESARLERAFHKVCDQRFEAQSLAVVTAKEEVL